MVNNIEYTDISPNVINDILKEPRFLKGNFIKDEKNKNIFYIHLNLVAQPF